MFLQSYSAIHTSFSLNTNCTRKVNATGSTFQGRQACLPGREREQSTACLQLASVPQCSRPLWRHRLCVWPWRWESSTETGRHRMGFQPNGATSASWGKPFVKCVAYLGCKLKQLEWSWKIWEKKNHFLNAHETGCVLGMQNQTFLTKLIALQSINFHFLNAHKWLKQIKVIFICSLEKIIRHWFISGRRRPDTCDKIAKQGKPTKTITEHQQNGW